MPTHREISDLLYPQRLSTSTYTRPGKIEEFLSDHSRILFSSSFRRLAKKAQVFSLEINPSVRNRLTHSLEVADIGRTLARAVAKKLQNDVHLGEEDAQCIISIVENACLLHDIGNPPFGHFGEAAIQKWFSQRFEHGKDSLEFSEQEQSDFLNFDGNPQGFRIATRLHCERDQFSLNLTGASILASIKYPQAQKTESGRFQKKIGFFSTETDVYQKMCELTGHSSGKRYFLAYLMELADDICYCLSDIADSFEKGIVTVSQYSSEMEAICSCMGVDPELLACSDCGTDFNFRFKVAIPLVKMIVDEAASLFVSDIDAYISGEAEELSDTIESGECLRCLKRFSRKFLYRDQEVQRIELAGFHIVGSLLDKFGILLDLPRSTFNHFVEQDDNLSHQGTDFEWRLFKRLSPRMVESYKCLAKNAADHKEWLARAHLIVDFISGMTDDSAKSLHQILTGTYGSNQEGAW